MTKSQTKTLDNLWSKAVHERDKVCCICGKTEGLNAHHIFTRRRMKTRWDLDNGILLCVGHHNRSSLISAHLAPRAFFTWLEGNRGKRWLNALERRSQGLGKGLQFEEVKKCLTKNKSKKSSA